MLLLEEVQLRWLPGANLSEDDLARALRANPAVAWYLRNKCPDLDEWVGRILRSAPNTPSDPDAVRQSECAVLRAIEDWIVYVVDPAAYDRQQFLQWDSDELRSVADFCDGVVLDIGAGTGRLTLSVADRARVVYAVEPVRRLRTYLRDRAQERGFDNVYVVDGLIEEIPFEDEFADVTMAGHVFGDDPEKEKEELLRVTRPGGTVVLCPGNADRDDETHASLLAGGFSWSRFEEPGDGTKRKYWRTR